MAEVIYVCPNCGMESDEPGTCTECDEELEAKCAVCWRALGECICEEEPEEGA